MEPRIEIKRRARWLARILPVAACLALAVPSAAALAQTDQTVSCSTAQKAGEGGGGYAGTTAMALQKAGEGEGGTNMAQQKTGVIPCKG
jgi:uncharacterized low-complexity protein